MSVSTRDAADTGLFTAHSISEEDLRLHDAPLRLSLHGGARWSEAVVRGQLNGLRMSLDAGVSLRLKRIALLGPTELLLYLERHATLDVSADTPLTLSVVHACQGSALEGAALPACHDGDIDSAAGASVLSASHHAYRPAPLSAPPARGVTTNAWKLKIAW